MSKPIIAVDIDEVLAQFIPSLAVFHNENYGVVTDSDNISQKTELTIDSFISYEFHKVWGGTFEEANAKMYAFFESAHFREKIQPVPYAKEVLWKLKDNYSLHIVTARQYAVEDITRAWINHHYPDIFDEVHFGNHYSTEGKSRSKLEICHEIKAQLLIDDSIVYAAQCGRGNDHLNGLPVILFGHYPWNKEFPHKEAPHIQINTRTQNVKEAHVLFYHDDLSATDLEIFQKYQQKPVIRVKSWQEILKTIQVVLPSNYYHEHLHLTRNQNHDVIARNQLHVIALQLNSTNDKSRNLSMIGTLVEEIIQRYQIEGGDNQVDVICLPECCAFIGNNAEETLQQAENIPTGDIFDSNGSIYLLSQLAKKFNVWLSIGGFAEKQRVSNGEEKISNSHMLINRQGELQTSVYRKVHLFDCPYVGLQESKHTVAGDEIVVHDIEGWKVGLSICYDLRFPLFYDAMNALSYSQYQSPLDVILVPAAFTIPTGQAHWEILLRARAIESQCYVIAAAQAGPHNEKRASYGHSIIVDPWGKVVSHLTDELQGYCSHTLEKERIEDIRKQMPIQDHKRYDVYSKK